jgi:uncharacterized protein YutE (UPF0331/DUF86 family)
MRKDPDRLAHFMNGFAAAAHLGTRAAENGFMTEFIIMAASVIDGALRIGLVLQHQIDTQSSDVPENLVYQRDEEKTESERQIYRRSFERRIIDNGLYDELQNLFTARNRVVHRYIISDITTEQVFRIARRFEKAIQRVHDAVWKVEDQQTRLRVGMTRKSSSTIDMSELVSMMRAKHGAEWLARALRRRST